LRGDVKAGKWVIDQLNGMVIIRRAIIKKQTQEQKVIHADDLVEFSLVFNENKKMTGYVLKYDVFTKKLAIDFNYVHLIYHDDFGNKPVMDIVYEDHHVRLLTFSFENKMNYLLVGRWKE
jgi:hypothetical protein